MSDRFELETDFALRGDQPAAIAQLVDGLSRGDRAQVLVFPVGEAGAHQLVNRTEAAVRFLAVSTGGAPDIVVHADSRKVGAFERRPDGSGMRLWFREADAVDYHEGEEPPA